MLRDVAVTAILPLLANCLILAGMWTMMLLIHWKLALVAMVTLPLLVTRTKRAAGKIRESARRQRQREGEMASAAAESIASIKIVQSLSLEDAFADEFSQRNVKAQFQDVRNARLTAGLERSVDVLLAIATGLVLLYGSSLVVVRELTAGELIIFLTYLKRAFNPVQDFAKYTGRLAKAAAAGDRVLGVLDREPDVIDLPGAIEAPPFVGVVRFENVTFEYEPGRPVLQEIDFAVRPGQCVAIVGPSGGGKSTLANLIGRLYEPTAGRITIDGRDVRTFTLRSLRMQISVVLQDTLLFAATIRDNIAYAAPDADERQIRAAAELANAHEFVDLLPEGYATVLSERGTTLSGGQRQRLAVARAAVRHAPILVLDEPTAALDEANSLIVCNALQRLARDRTTFYITHDLEQAVRAEQILYIDGGRILERGTHQQLLAENGSYAKLYRLQSTTREQQRRRQRDETAQPAGAVST
jgi:ATP-binding cassette subfamily B protein